MADGAEYARLMEPVARKLLGAPRATHRGGMEWRYGNFESLKIEIDTGLFHDYEHDEKGGVLDFIKWHLGLPDRAEARRWLEQQGYLPREEKQPFEPGITYRYCDQDGTVVLKVSRWSQNGERRFTQRAPDPEHPGEWIKPSAVKGGAKRIPYRLPELLAAISEGRVVFYVEGEKDVDRLREVNITATTNSEGGNNHKWLPELVPYFAGADVVIIPDYDLKGQQHGERIAKLLTGTAKRVRLLDLSTIWPEIKIKNDVSDWLNNGGTAEALMAAAEQLSTWGLQKRTAKVIPFRDRDIQHEHVPWFDELRKKNGYPITDVRNVLIALRADQRFAGCFAFNEMLQEPVLLRNPPLAPGNMADCTVPRKISENDIIRLQEFLQDCRLDRLGIDVVNLAVEELASEHRFHPLRDWLDTIYENSEKSDTFRELNSWLHKYFGCPDDDYHRAVGRMYAISMVARIYEPGCKADYMLVLEGQQGEIKSEACRALAGEYFSDSLPPIDKDPIRVSMHLRGKWLIEISELSAISKADVELLKHFISRRFEQYTPKYGRRECYEPRQCLFIGTTNKTDYLKDETGGRRFWPVKCGQIIDIDGLCKARETMFAEAVDQYKQKAHWWPDREFEKNTITPEQQARLEVDIWQPIVKDWLDKQIVHSFTLAEIAQGALGPGGYKSAQFGVGEQRRLGAVLRLCHWKREHTETGNCWVRNKPTEPSEPF